MNVLNEVNLNNDSYISHTSSNIINKINTYFRSYFTNNFDGDLIIDKIYIGSINSIFDNNTLNKLNIHNIISVVNGFVPPTDTLQEFIVIDALDSIHTDLSIIFNDIVKYIEKLVDENKPILVHCIAGRSRSVTIVIAYIIKRYGFPVEKALIFVQSKRKISKPNDTFMYLLKNYYNQLYHINEWYHTIRI